MANHAVFISYDHSEDVHYKRLLEAWDANSNFDFQFENHSVRQPINSIYAPAIKTAITKKMQNASHLLVIVGAKSYTSSWIEWEINKAKELGLKIAAVKINSTLMCAEKTGGFNLVN
jgi:hypothetical protein